MAEQVKAPAACCFNLSDRSISADVAALAQPMAIAVHASRRGRIAKDDVVLVIGAGGIGSFLTFATAATGATVTAMDIDPAKLAIAMELGAARTVDALHPEALAERIATEVGPPTLVFECTATPDCLRLAVETVADNGRVVVVGHQPEPVAVPFKQVSFGEKELIGTMAQAFAADFAPAIDLVTERPEVWTRIAPMVFPLEDLLTAGLIPMAERRATQIKTLFDPSLQRPRPLQIRP
jgi:(R,R)-butanediol dehydrogenase/meso-butanediol dehydrogenase/diacetyl reductase